MDREVRRGRFRRWGAIVAALIRAGGVWVRRALLRHRFVRRAATAAVVNKEHRKGEEAVCSKNPSPPRQNRDRRTNNRQRRNNAGDIRDNAGDIGDLGAEDDPNNGNRHQRWREETAAHSEDEQSRHQIARVAPRVEDSGVIVGAPPQARREENEDGVAKEATATPSADAVTATHRATLVDSKNQEPEARRGPATPSTKAGHSAATPSSRGGVTKVGDKSAGKAKHSGGAARPVRKNTKPATATPRQTELSEEKGGYGLDLLFADEAGDPERIAHASYGEENRRCKGYTLCLTCYLNGRVKKIRDHNEMMGHCNSAHQDVGTKCQKKGCIARGNNKHEIGLHEYVCHNI